MKQRFAWDSDKDKGNQRKHHIAFSVAKKVFQDPYVIDYIPDDEHSGKEDRYIAIGMVKKVIFVSYTIRYGDVIRIISARPATKEEGDFYYDYNGLPRPEQANGAYQGRRKDDR